MDLWKNVGKDDWNNLDADHKKVYKQAARDHNPLKQGSEPPRKSNNYKVPEFKDHAWGWDFIQDDPDFDDESEFSTLIAEESDMEWREQTAIGKGTYGSVHSWTKSNKVTGATIQRVAVKESPINKEDWEDPQFWYDWPKTRIPREIAALRRLNRDPQNPFVVECLGHRMNGQRRESNGTTYRIVMPQLPLDGSSFGVYWRLLDFEKNEIPECYWMDFMSGCITAVRFLVERNLFQPDITPHNILLCLTGEGDMRQFDPGQDATGWSVKPVFADFGSAAPLRSRVFNNPDDLLGLGTVAFISPECATREKSREDGSHLLPGHIIDDKAMVFGVGCAIFYMLMPPSDKTTRRQFRGRSRPRDLYDGEHAPADDMKHIEKQFAWTEGQLLGGSTVADRYPNLKKILVSCLRLKPEHRPTCDEVLASLKASRPATDPKDADLFKDLKSVLAPKDRKRLARSKTK